MDIEAPLDAAAIATGFRLLLRRPPENEAVVQHYLSLRLSFGAFLDVLMGSEEFRERQRRGLALAELAGDAPPAAAGSGKRVLLFGAYGNGNVGDAAQAAALASLLRTGFGTAFELGRVAACSWERRRPYPADGIEVLRPDALLRPEVVRPRGPGDAGGADLVVIGGGGLLGTPHFPLHARAWAEWFVGRGVPFALLGVGGSATALAMPDWQEAYTLLLTRAAFVGLRDAETLEAARPLRPDAAWFPDPVLAAALLGPPAPPGPRTLDAVLIPRAPNRAADRAALTGLLGFAASLRAAGRSVVVAALERDADAAELSGPDIRFVADWDELLGLCRQARAVVSARLHGSIAGLASGCVVHGLAQPKTGDLMRRLGVEAWFHPGGWPDAPPDLSEAAAAAFRAALAPGLLRLREDGDHAMRLAAAALRSALAPARASAPARKGRRRG